MALRYVAPAYKVTGSARSPWGGNAPLEVEQAFNSIIMFTNTRQEEDWGNLEEYKYLSAVFNPEGVREAVMNNIAPRIICLFPKLKGRGRTAYICPIISQEGYLNGYVVAKNAADALTAAKYMAGGA